MGLFSYAMVQCLDGKSLSRIRLGDTEKHDIMDTFRKRTMKGILVLF